jgi:hypothetical protein
MLTEGNGGSSEQQGQQQQRHVIQRQHRIRFLGIDMEGANAAVREQLGKAGKSNTNAGYRQVSVTQPGGLPGLLSEVTPGSGITGATGGHPEAARGAQLPEQVVIEAQRVLLSQQGSGSCMLVHYGGMELKHADKGMCYCTVDVAQEPALTLLSQVSFGPMPQKDVAVLFGVNCQHSGWHAAYSDAWMCLHTLRGCAQGFWNSLMAVWRSREGVWLHLEKAMQQLIKACGGQGLQDMEMVDAKLQLMFALRLEYIQERNSR